MNKKILFIAIILIVLIIFPIYYFKYFAGKSTEQIAIGEAEFENLKLFADKIDDKVYVRIRNGDKIFREFSYQEVIPYVADSGNSWESLPPNIALSPDGKKVAYSDIDSLKVLDIATNVITILRDHNKSDEAPSVRYFLKPEWSLDSRYVFYTQMLYEGSAIGVFDLKKQEYSDKALQKSPSITKIIQVNEKTYLIYFNSRSNDIYGGPAGLFAAEIRDVNNITFINLTESYSKECIEITDLYTNEDKVAFNYHDCVWGGYSSVQLKDFFDL